MLVFAEPARVKLAALTARGIGLQQAATLTHVAKSTLQRIRSGEALQITPRVSKAILTLERAYLAHGQKVSAWQMKRYVRALKDEDFTKREIAHRAGLHPVQLSQGHERITVATHLKVLKVWQSTLEFPSADV